MSLIAKTFADLKAQNKTALITFITAGDPAPGLSVALMHAMVAGGANILELGVPFSDPMAEGPVIQRACERALAQGVGIMDVFAMVAEFRKTNQHTPVVLMGYANPSSVSVRRALLPSRRRLVPMAPSWSITRRKSVVSFRRPCALPGWT